ncbi:MAG: hypothetical protein ACOYBQ_09495 [Fluviibacter sp.]
MCFKDSNGAIGANSMLNPHEPQSLYLGILAMSACQRLNFNFRQNDVCIHVITSSKQGDGIRS